MAHARPRILAVDFDGPIHSYLSGWKGARNIPDPPTVDVLTGQTSITWLRRLIYDQRNAFVPRYGDYNLDVCIFSSRCRHWGGAAAIKAWLATYGMRPGEIEALRFPLLKPPAHLFLDDRAIRFTGTFPTAEEILAFKPIFSPISAPRNDPQVINGGGAYITPAVLYMAACTLLKGRDVALTNFAPASREVHERNRDWMRRIMIQPQAVAAHTGVTTEESKESK